MNTNPVSLFADRQTRQAFLQALHQGIIEQVMRTRNTQTVRFSTQEVVEMTGGRGVTEQERQQVVDFINQSDWYFSNPVVPDALGRAYVHPRGIFILFSAQLEGYFFSISWVVKPGGLPLNP